MSDLEHIGEDLAGVLRRMGLPDPDAANRLVEAWENLAGEPWASRSRPAGIHAGVLRVEVSDPATAALLRYRVAQLLERLDGLLGPGEVTSVKITVGDRRKLL